MFVASDVEGTLSSGAFWKGVGRYLLAHGRALGYRVFFLTRLPGVYLTRLKLIDAGEFGNRWILGLAKQFRGMTSDELNSMGDWVVENELWPKRRQAVVDELRRHRDEGRRVVLASGTFQPALDSLARRIGAEALGTALDMAGGRATGRVGAPLNVGKAKAERLRAVLAARPLEAAYGDTLADVPMLEMSRHPVAVSPDSGLRAVAVERGWRILDDGPSSG